MEIAPFFADDDSMSGVTSILSGDLDWASGIIIAMALPIFAVCMKIIYQGLK